MQTTRSHRIVFPFANKGRYKHVNRQKVNSCQFVNPGELATGSQMLIRFERGLEHNS